MKYHEVREISHTKELLQNSTRDFGDRIAFRFKSEDGKEIVYHPASISDASGHIAPRLLEMKNEYVTAMKLGIVQDDLDSII